MNRNKQSISIGQGEHRAFASLRLPVLSEEEKCTMRQTLQASIQRSQPVSTVVPVYRKAGLFAFFLNRSFALSVFSIALVIGSGFSVARAAENSLPGQALYPMKINVNESVIGSFKRSDTARADWERERVGRRVREAETLAEAGKLGDEEKNEIEQHLSENRKTIEKIEGRDITDDEFFPQQIIGETKKINVRVEHTENETFVHIDERNEIESDEDREKGNGWVDEGEKADGDASFGGYTEQGTKVENKKKLEKKSDSESQNDKQSSGERKTQKNGDQKDFSSEKSGSSDKQDVGQDALDQIGGSGEQKDEQ